jgi:clan AA aspartic protease
MSEMRTFRTAIQIQNWGARERIATVPGALVDTGSEFTWVPEEILIDIGIAVEDQRRFVTATGERVERDVGYAIVHAAGAKSVDEIVFAKPGDMILLGARSLEGLNLKVDPKEKLLVPAGRILAAAAAQYRACSALRGRVVCENVATGDIHALLDRENHHRRAGRGHRHLPRPRVGPLRRQG